MIRRTPFTLALAFSAGFFSMSTASGAEPQKPGEGKYETGTRSGPFVASDKSLTALAGEGYEIRANLGTALILQKGPSIYSCQIPPDPETLSFKPYFVCAELKEEPRTETAPTPREAPLPRKGN
ncbi:MAG: hypothetical protein RLO15_04855 [Parvibaculum sp.]